MSQSLVRLVLGALAVGVFALTACGDDADEGAVATTALPGTAHTDHPVVTIGLRDYAFDDVPATVAAGTSLGVTNASTKEVHELIAIRLPDDERRRLTELSALSPSELEGLFVEEPAAVLVAPPGEDGMAVVGDGTLEQSGRYLLMCMVPIGADPQEFLEAATSGAGPPQVDGGPPHFTGGMIAELTVTA